MDPKEIGALVYGFARDARLIVILALIIADVVLALAEAIKAREFEWRRLGEFYQTMILPYVLGYLVFYVLVGLSIGFDAFFGQAAVTTAFGSIVSPLLASIVSHAGAIGLGIKPVQNEPYIG